MSNANQLQNSNQTSQVTEVSSEVNFNIKEKMLSDTVKLSMYVSTCTFYKKKPVNLIDISLLEEDNSYLTKKEIAAGKKGWMCIGNMYFHEYDIVKALREFDKKVAEWPLFDRRTVTGIRIDDLPDEGTSGTNNVCEVIHDLMKFPHNQKVRVSGTSGTANPLVAHSISGMTKENFISKDQSEQQIVLINLK